MVVHTIVLVMLNKMPFFCLFIINETAGIMHTSETLVLQYLC